MTQNFQKVTIADIYLQIEIKISKYYFIEISIDINI